MTPPFEIRDIMGVAVTAARAEDAIAWIDNKGEKGSADAVVS